MKRGLSFGVVMRATSPSGGALDHPSGGWAITGGTGDYEQVAGGGTITAKARSVDTGGVDTMTGAITR